MSVSSSDTMCADSAREWDAMLSNADDDVREAIGRCIASTSKWSCPAGLQVCPPKFGTKLPGRVSDLKYKKDPDQRLAFLLRVSKDAEQLMSASKWSKELVVDTDEWWSVHLNDKAIRVACAMFLHSSWTAPSVKKAQCVSELVAAQVPVLPLHILALWFEQTHVTGRLAPNVASVPGPKPAPRVPVPVPVADAVPGPSAADPQSVADVPVVAAPLDPQPDDAVQRLLAVLTQAVSAGLPQSKLAPCPLSVAPTLSGYEAWEQAKVAAIVSLGFVDCHTVSAANRETMKRRKHGRNQARPIQLGNGLSFAGGGDEDPYFNDDYDPASFMSGLSFYINTLSQCDAVKDRVPDVLAWSVLVEEQRASDRCKVAYMKEFMYKYRGPASASDWTGKVNTDNLLRSFLHQEPPGSFKRQFQHDSSSSRQPVKRHGSGRPVPPPSRGRGRSAPFARGGSVWPLEALLPPGTVSLASA